MKSDKFLYICFSLTEDMLRPQKVAIVVIALLTSFLGFFGGFLLGELTYMPLIIGILPLVLGRIFFGHQALDHLEAIYAASIAFQATLYMPAELYPPPYTNFFNGLISTFVDTSGRIAVNLDAALTYEIVLGSVFVFLATYSYRERYFQEGIDKL